MSTKPAVKTPVDYAAEVTGIKENAIQRLTRVSFNRTMREHIRHGAQTFFVMERGGTAMLKGKVVKRSENVVTVTIGASTDQFAIYLDDKYNEAL